MNVVTVEDSPGIRQLLLKQVIAMRSEEVVAEAWSDARAIGMVGVAHRVNGRRPGADVFHEDAIDVEAALVQLATWARHLHAQGECTASHRGEEDRFPDPAPAVH